MPRRTLVTLLAVAAVIALAAILPRTPPGRAWLLGRVDAALQASGVTLRYHSSSGNPWTGLRLQGAQVRAPGVELQVDELAVRYFLPSLITGDLPLSLELSGVRGSIEVSRLKGPTGGGGGLPVKPVLQQLTVSDASVSVQQVPYTIPSGAISDIRIHQHGNSLDLQAQLHTADGSAEASGVLDLSGPRFDGQVTRADVGLARHWFPGARAGTVSGPLHVGPDGIRGDFQLHGGALDAIGLHPRDIQGVVQLRYPLITATLQGDALGGPVRAHGTVNIAARHWQAHAQGTPALRAAADWLLRSSLPAGRPLPLSGTASTTLDLSGWTAVHVSGSADGSGAFAGLSLGALQSDFSYDSRRGVTVQANGRVAGGSAVATVAATPAGTRVEATVQRARPAPGQSVDASVQLELARAGTGGKLTVTDHATLPDRRASLTLDAGLDRDGWQGVVSGNDSLGAAVEGAVALKGGRISGEIRAHRLALPGISSPATVSLRADGPLSAVALRLALAGDAPLLPTFGPESVAADLRGHVDATLTGSRLRGVAASLGPVTASGAIDLAPLAGSLRLTLAPSQLRGPVEAHLGLQDATLAFGGSSLRAGATLTPGTVTAGPLTLQPGPLALSSAGTSASVLRLAASSGRLTVQADRQGLHARFGQLPVDLAGTPLTLDGSVALPFGRGLAGLDPNLRVHGAGATLTLQRTAGTLQAVLSAPSGSALGPVTLARPLRATATVDAADLRGSLSGSLGDLPLRANAAWNGGAPHLEVTAGSGADLLRGVLDPAGWRLRGALDLGRLGPALGLPLQGRLTSDLRGATNQPSLRYQGSATVRTSAPLQAQLTLEGAGSQLRAVAQAELAGQSLTARGALLPSLSLSARAGPLGPIAVEGTRLSGSGTLAGGSLAPSLVAQPQAWSLSGSLAPLDLRLALGRGRLHLRGSTLAAALALPVDYAGHVLEARLATAGAGTVDPFSGAPVVDLAQGLDTLPLAAELRRGDAGVVLRAHGTAGALVLSGALPATLLAAPLPPAARPPGSVTLEGQASLTQGIRYQLDASWRNAAASIEGSLTGTAASYQLVAKGSGLALQASPKGVSLAAERAPLAGLLPGLPGDARLDGALDYRQGRWSGALHLEASGPLVVSADLAATAGGLRVDASAHAGPAALHASGTLLPRLQLQGDVTAYGGVARLDARTQGQGSGLRVAGDLAVKAAAPFPWLRLPARRASLTWNPGDGSIAGHGDGFTLDGTLHALRASLTLPASLLGNQETLALTVAGPIAGPSFSGTLAGALLHGTVSGSAARGADASLVLGRGALSARLGAAAALLGSDVTLAGHLATNGAWTADAGTTLAKAAAGLELAASLQGQGSSYQGTLAASPPAPSSAALASVALRGRGAQLGATLDLAALDTRALGRLLGVPLDLQASGQARFSTEPLAASLQADVSGSAAGRPLSLRGHAGGGAGVDLQASYAGIAAALRDSGSGGGLGLDLSGPAGLALQGALQLAGEPGLSLGGRLHGLQASLQAKARPAAGSGTLQARLGAATLQLAVSPSGPATRVELSASIPDGSLSALGSGLAGTLQGQATLSGGQVTLGRFAARSPRGPTPWALDLRGPAYPEADLTGSVRAPGWQAGAELGIRGPPDRLRLRATLDQLTLDASTRGTGLEAFSADGAARLAALPGGIDIRARTLAWTRQRGFTGSALLQLPGTVARLPGTIDLSLTGSGSLHATARAGPTTKPWATVRARLAANPLRDRALQGTVQLAAPVARWAGLPGAAQLHLTGSPTLAGSWAHPVVDGPLDLSGALQAAGTVHLEPGNGRIELHGPHTTLQARLDGSGWTAALALDGASLAPFQAALKDATVSLRANVFGGATGIRGTVGSLTLRAPGASLTGSASLDRGVRVALQAKADLSALALPGPPLQGLLHGPLVLAAPSLADLAQGDLVAVVDVARLGTAGMDGSLAGTLQVGGSLANPSLSAALQGSGQVQGRLRVDATPAQGRFDLSSTLAYHALATDLSLRLRTGGIQASGQLRVGGAGASLTDGPDGSLLLRGSQRLEGWQARVAPDLGSASLTGPLAALGIGAGGSLELRLGGRPWLRGGVQGARVRGVELGDLTLDSPRAGAAIAVGGPHLAGSLEPAALAWQVKLDRQPLPQGYALSGEARGSGATGRADLQLDGTLAGAPVALAVKASNQNGTSLQASGPLLGGTLQARASLGGTRQWTGSLSLASAHVAGLGVGVTGSVDGAAADPALHATLALEGAVAGSARVDASRAGTRLDATLAGAALGGTLDLRGAVTPSLDLTVQAAAGDRSRGRVRLVDAAGALRADGRLRLASGPLRVSLSGSGRDTPAELGLQLPAVPGLLFRGELPSEPAAALAATLVSKGLTLHGSGATRGALTLRLTPAPQAEMRSVRLDYLGTTLSADGSVGLGKGSVRGTLTLPDRLPVDHVGGTSLPYRLELSGARATLSSDSRLGTIRASVDAGTGNGSLQADLHTLAAGGGAAAGSATVDLTVTPSQGANGDVAVHGIRVQRAGLPALSVSADARIRAGTVSGNADIAAADGGVHVDGRWGLAGLLPSTLARSAPSGGTLEARVSTFQLASLPTIARLVPHVRGAVSGIVRVRNANVVGQLVAPDFAVAATPLPLDLQLSGPFDDLSARLKLGASVATATVTPGHAKGLLTFHRFPAQVLAEANVGPMDVKAEVDGLLRFDVPFEHLADSYLRLATESVKLERSGVVTTGNVAFAYADRTLSIDRASFQGRGTWQAQGTVGADKLDLGLRADHADFGPLLGLVPLFARYGVGASGSISLVAQGTPAKPSVTLTARSLDAEVAGTRYRLDHADIALNGSALTASAAIEGVAPLGGSLAAHGGAHLTLAPLAITNADFRFTGSAQVPVFGKVSDISGGITQPPGSAPQLAVAGKLGRPFTIQGSLAPFDVTLRGQGIDLRAAPLLVSSSAVDANVRMKATKAGLALGGELDASEIRMNVGAAPAAGTGSAPGGSSGTSGSASAAGSSGSGPAPGSAAGGPSATPATAPATPGARAAGGTGSGQPASASAASSAGSRAALRAVIFDHLHLRAPQRVLLDASFGSMEASLDLTLTGTAAAPELSGTARALRGSLRFGGRDFTVDRAVATFQPSRGVYPSLDVQAHTTFDKRRVLTGTSGVSFASPRQGTSFTVTLSFSGRVQPSQTPGAPVTFDINPTLTSDATVQTGGAGATSAPRALSNGELLSLVTLGRLEVKPQLAGQAGFGTAVAQSAIDTAVNVLVVNELQNALSKALGLDVVEINTTPLSSLIDNSGQPFGVSLRVGGYLTPQLFASYRLGNVSGSGENYAFTNEVTLSYDLGPLNLDLSGQLSFPDAATSSSPVPQLGVGLRYAFTPGIGLEAGVDLSNVSQQARFGVSFRW